MATSRRFILRKDRKASTRVSSPSRSSRSWATHGASLARLVRTALIVLACVVGAERAAAQPWIDRSPTAVEALPAADLTTADRSAIDAVVGRQLRAIRDDDGGVAFALATARLRRQLGSPAALMNLVRRDYGEIYRPRSVSSEDFVQFRGYPTRRLRVVGANGSVVVAYYMMRQDEGGNWRVAGCVLARMPAETS